MNIFKTIFNRKSEVTVNLDKNVKLTVTPTVGGVNATIEEVGDIFIRRESAFFASLSDLVSSLRLTDDVIVRKLSKAF